MEALLRAVRRTVSEGGLEAAATKPRPKAPFEVPWHVVSTVAWDEDYFNEEVPGVHRIRKHGTVTEVRGSCRR